MPRVNLGRDPEQGKTEYRRRLIDGKAHFSGYKTKKDFARVLKVNCEWVSRRFDGATKWSLDDIAKLDNVLRFTTDELASLVRGR